MKHRIFLFSTIALSLVLLLASTGTTACGTSGRVATRPHPAGYPGGQNVVVDVSIFYDELSPYGNWFELAGYGWVWTPNSMGANWRPYTDGYWVWTEFGWTWVSNLRWGWGPFHYGRWIYHRPRGWVWIPGTVWGPGWVVWRHGPGRIGWAPLPPQAGWQTGVGLRADWGAIDRIIEPQWYSFVDERRINDRNLGRWIDPPDRNINYINVTQNVTRIEASGNRVIDRSIDIRRIEQATGQSIRERRVIDSPPDGGGMRGDDLHLYRPNIDNRPPARIPREGAGSGQIPNRPDNAQKPQRNESPQQHPKGGQREKPTKQPKQVRRPGRP